MSVSILILNHHDEGFSGCLHSVKWSDDVHVLDSTDSAHIRSLADRHGARVTHCADPNLPSLQEAAIAEIPFQYPWLLILNAHERACAAIKAELELMLFHSDPEMPFRIRRIQTNGNKPTQPTHTGALRLRKLSSRLVSTLSHHRGHTSPSQTLERQRIPWRAFANFAHTLLFKRAFLNGRQGIARACLSLIHDCTVTVNPRKHQTKQQEPSPPQAAHQTALMHRVKTLP
jgi:hypothetical protein